MMQSKGGGSPAGVHEAVQKASTPHEPLKAETRRTRKKKPVFI